MSTVTLNAENFERTITENPARLHRHRPGRLVGLMVRALSPVRPNLRSRRRTPPDIVFGKVDTEAERMLASAANITSIPTLMVFKDGTLVFSQPGALPPAALEDVIVQARALEVDRLHCRSPTP